MGAGAPLWADSCLPFCPARRDISGFNVPILILSADFEEEGSPDLAVVQDAIPGGPDGILSILRGDAEAGFPLLSTWPLGHSPVAAAIADFNQDMHKDVVVVDFLDVNMKIFLGNGEGGFSSSSTIALPAGPVAVAAGNFTGDSFPDIVLATYPTGFPGTLRVYQGNGLGGFTQLTTAGLDVDPRAIVISDLDKNGIPDIAVGHRVGQTVKIFMGTGGGFLASPNTLSVGASIRSLVVTDLNNDLKRDLVGGGDTVASSVVAMLGDGLGGFSIMPGVPLGSDIPSVSVCDYDKDGKPDVIAAKFSQDALSLLRGKGDGSFFTPVDLGANSRPMSILSSDLNKDGICDTISANRAAGTLSLFLADGFGSLGTPRFATGTSPLGVIAADVNGDGRIDIATANRDSGTVSILTGDGNGGFALTQTLSAQTNPGSIAFGDLSGDGFLDIAVANQGVAGSQQAQPVSLYFGDGFGGFPYQTSVSAGRLPLDVIVDDFTGDGLDDLAVANADSDTVSFFEATGGGSFGPRKNAHTGVQPRALAALDADGDGVKDLAVSQGGDNSIGILIGDGAGGFALSAVSLPGSENNTDDVVAADLNGDGRDDIVFLNQDQVNTPARVSVWLSDGVDGFYEAASSGFQTGIFSESLLLADIDRKDGLDLVVANRFSDSIGVYLGDGAGGFTYSQDYGSGRQPFAMAAADFNRDDRIDIATADFYGNSTSVLLNNTFIDPGFQSVHPVDSQNFTWTPVPGASTYRVYRGLTSILYSRDYGTCLTNNAVTAFSDPGSPPAGKAYFYLVTPLIAGVESHMGLDSGCLKRVNRHPCPL